MAPPTPPLPCRARLAVHFPPSPPVFPLPCATPCMARLRSIFRPSPSRARPSSRVKAGAQPTEESLPGAPPTPPLLTNQGWQFTAPLAPCFSLPVCTPLHGEAALHLHPPPPPPPLQTLTHGSRLALHLERKVAPWLAPRPHLARLGQRERMHASARNHGHLPPRAQRADTDV